MKLLIKILIITLCWYPCFTFGAVDTINPVPGATSSFLADLQTYLEQEDGDRNFPRFGSSIIKGGIHAAGAGLAHTVTALTAFSDGFYVAQDASAKTYTASKDTFVFVRLNDTATLTFGGAAITYDDFLAYAETSTGTAYAVPNAGFTPLMEVITDATDVTTVTDMRSGFVVAEWYTNFATALTDSVNRTLFLTETHVLAANTTIGTTNDVVILGNAKIILGAYNLTINGGFHAPPWEVIDDTGAGSVSYGSKDRIAFGDWTGDDFVYIYEGGTNVVAINADYGIKVALQTSFLVKPAASQDNMDLNGGDVTVVWGTEIYDIDGNFASNTFTAPTAGKYHFDISVVLNDVDADYTYLKATLSFSSRTSLLYETDPQAHLDADADFDTIAWSITVDMAESETVAVTLAATAGADITDVSTESRWSGYLVH